MSYGGLIALTLFAIPSLAGAADTLSAVQEEQVALFERIAPAVVAVRQGDSAATGFAVAPDLVVTAAHALGAATEVEVSLRDGRVLRGKVLERSQDGLDVALVRVDGTLAAALELSVAPEIRTGAVVATVGHGDGGRWSLSTGLVSNDAPAGPDGGLVTLQLPLRPGASGGPVVDLSGRVVGIVAHGAPGTIAFAVRSDAALRSLAGLAAIGREPLALAPVEDVAGEAAAEPAPLRAPELLVGPADPRSTAATGAWMAPSTVRQHASRVSEQGRGQAPVRMKLHVPASREEPPPPARRAGVPLGDGLASATLLACGVVALAALAFAGGRLGSRAPRSDERATTRRAHALRVLPMPETRAVTLPPAPPPPPAPALHPLPPDANHPGSFRV